MPADMHKRKIGIADEFFGAEFVLHIYWDSRKRVNLRSRKKHGSLKFMRLIREKQSSNSTPSYHLILTIPKSSCAEKHFRETDLKSMRKSAKRSLP